MDATYALGTTLKAPAGFMTMCRYDDAVRSANIAKDALDQTRKRPSRAREAALERLNIAYGKEMAYRDALANMVVDASGYTVARHDAIRAINDELDAMGEACWLAPVGRMRMLAMASTLCSITS